MRIRIRGPTLLLFLKSRANGFASSTFHPTHHSSLSLVRLPSPSSSLLQLTAHQQKRHHHSPTTTFATRFRGGSNESRYYSTDTNPNTNTKRNVSSPSTNIPSNTALHASPTDNDIDEITTTKEEIHQEATKALSIAGGENAVSYFATIPYLHTTPTTSQQQHRQHRVLFILGGPGAGKGTQSSNIVSTYHCIHLSAGDLLREERAAGAADGGNNADHPHAALIEECLVAGKIVPVAITLSLLQRAMDQATTSSSSSSTTTTHGSPIFLIDGFPRNFDNLSGWVENVSPSTTSVLGALVYDCPIDILEKRIMGRAATSGRSDDNLTSARRRFVTFGKETVPVVQVLSLIHI